MSYYSTEIKSRKWYLNIVSHLVEASLHNSFILYCKSKAPKLNYLNFHKSVIESLVLGLKTQKKRLSSQKEELLKPESMIIEYQLEDCALAINGKFRMPSV